MGIEGRRKGENDEQTAWAGGGGQQKQRKKA
jgi:hypothetical protein